MGRAPVPNSHFPNFIIINILHPFSFSPTKKGQKERRRSARSRFFRESPQRYIRALVPYEPFRCSGTTVLDGIARKNSPRHNRMAMRYPAKAF